MRKLTIGATLALLAIVTGATVQEVSDAPAWIVAVSAALAAAAGQLAAFPALRALAERLPVAAKRELALAYGATVAVLESVQLTVIEPPSVLRVALTALIALAGAAGLRRGVTPVVDPRAADGTPLRA